MATFAEAPGAEEFEAQGVPADEAPQVALLAETLAEDFARYGDEALRDASTLLRFLRAREGKVVGQDGGVFVVDDATPLRPPHFLRNVCDVFV